MSGRQARFTQDFVDGMRTMENLPRQKADRLVRAVASTTGEALVVGNDYGPGTPVDTGNARGHWYTTIGEGEAGGSPHPPSGHEGAAVLTHQAMDNVALAAAAVRAGDVISFNNDAEYIEELNHGHSAQAPQGMTDVVAMNFERIVADEGRRLGIIE
jgi:hypothetical protein